MKKNYFFLATAALGVMSLASCSQDELVTENPVIPSTGIEEPAEFYANSARLVDANGNEVSSFSNKFNKCFLEIKSAGAWSIENDNAFVYVSRKSGYGNALVPVQVGVNWDQARNFVLNVEFDEATTRADDKSTTTVTGGQAANEKLNAVKDNISSNLFVGYGYTPGMASQPELSTNIQIFDLSVIKAAETDKLKGKNVIQDELFESSYQQWVESNTEENLDLKISGSLSASGTFTKFGIKATGSGSMSSSENTTTVCTQKMLVHTHFTREIHYDQLIGDNGYLTDYLTPGFKYYKKNLISAIKKNPTKAEELAMDFVEVVGSHFVTKASLGYELDYRMMMDSTGFRDTIQASAVLNCKFQSVVKPETESLPNGDYSKYEAYSVSLIYHDDDHKDSIFTTNHKIEEEFKLPAKDPVKKKYVFLGWYKDDKKIEKDYDIRKLLTKNNDNIKLEAKWKSEKEESATPETPQEGNKTNIELGASVKFSAAVQRVASGLDAQVRLRGGDVSKVNILVTGGQLESSQVSEWLLSIEPERATMVDVQILPIYHLFSADGDEANAYSALKTYIDKYYPKTPKTEEKK